MERSADLTNCCVNETNKIDIPSAIRGLSLAWSYVTKGKILNCRKTTGIPCKNIFLPATEDSEAPTAIRKKQNEMHSIAYALTLVYWCISVPDLLNSDKGIACSPFSLDVEYVQLIFAACADNNVHKVSADDALNHRSEAVCILSIADQIAVIARVKRIFDSRSCKKGPPQGLLQTPQAHVCLEMIEGLRQIRIDIFPN